MLNLEAATTAPLEATFPLIGREREWAQLQADYSGRKPVRVFYQLWHQPLMTINREHLIHQAITACGGTNIFAELPTFTPTVSWEVAVQRNPQVIAMAGAPSAGG